MARLTFDNGEMVVVEDTPSRGLGDTVAKLARAVGIKPCGGCKKRQEKLNQIFPYKKEPD